MVYQLSDVNYQQHRTVNVILSAQRRNVNESFSLLHAYTLAVGTFCCHFKRDKLAESYGKITSSLMKLFLVLELFVSVDT